MQFTISQQSFSPQKKRTIFNQISVIKKTKTHSFDELHCSPIGFYELIENYIGKYNINLFKIIQHFPQKDLEVSEKGGGGFSFILISCLPN